MSTALMIAVVAAPGLGGFAAVRAGRGADRGVAFGFGVAVVAATVLLIGTGLAEGGRWTGASEAGWLALSVDRVAALLLVGFTLLGSIVSVYAARAFDDAAAAGAFQQRLAWLVGGAALVALPGGPIPLLAGWLISSRALAGLVSGWVDTAAAATAVARLRRTMLIADLALVAAVVIAVAASSAAITGGSPAAVVDLQADATLGVGTDVFVAALVVIAGAARSALVPFHRWLTATLYAPTPVSAIVHAGFVAGAGLLLLRFAPVIAGVDVVLWPLGVAAVLTIAIGIVASLSRPDAKGALAWSTVAQMAFMVVQVLVGGFAAAALHIVGHGMYKASQFLGVGDTVAASLRSRRRPQPGRPMSPAVRSVLAVVIASLAVTVGASIGPDGLGDAEQVLLYGAAWLSLAAAVAAVAGGQTHGRSALVAIATLGGLGASVFYFAALAVAKSFLEPAIPSAVMPAEMAMTLAVATLAVGVGLAVVGMVPAAMPFRAAIRGWVDLATAVTSPLAPVEPAGGVGAPAAVRRPVPAVAPDEASRAALRAQINRAAEVVAPAWPLSSFVAVNPLGGLEEFDFDQAGVEADVLWGRVYRPVDEFRADHAAGVTSDADLGWAAVAAAPAACSVAVPGLAGASVDALQIVMADLLHGPVAPPVVVPRTELERRAGVEAAERSGVADLVTGWVLDHLARPTWALAPDGATFWATARLQIVRHARRTLGPPAVDFAESLSIDPVDAVDAALRVSAVSERSRIRELRGLLASVRGSVGLARWRTDWAESTETSPMIRVAEIAAARAALDALLVIELEYRHGIGAGPEVVDLATTDVDEAQRIAAVVDVLDLPAGDETERAIADVLALLPARLRPAIWQRAQERRFDHGALTRLEQADPGPSASRPASQVVFCIDVRSEGLRRNLEAAGEDETIGFAGFFGIPMRVQEVGWVHEEPRCPVLVTPTTVATEHAEPTDRRVHRRLRRRARLAATALSHKGVKRLPGAAFVAAEATGLFSAARAARRTFFGRTPDRFVPLTTVVRFDPNVGLEQRVFWAESVLTTMGLTERFARLVVLCGHTSDTVNNAHGTALECGACGGAGGAMNARAVATLLNDVDVRSGLAGRGIEIPDDTWFTSAIHETATDQVDLLDSHLVPAGHHADVEALAARLAAAGRRQAIRRAQDLPGDPSRIYQRGADWAQPRPEWGLATNAAFVIAPRSATAGVDLDGRAFLHSYDSTTDPDGSVLEAIMTAPLVVGHWISAQYYFSTVDPDVFGAGDKLLHNPVGSLGVLTGAAGDLRVGLPLQSTHVGGRAHHQPLRLLAMIQAEPMQVDAIIARNPVLRRLVEGSWLRIAARPNADEAWSERSCHGTWSTEPRVARPAPVVQTR